MDFILFGISAIGGLISGLLGVGGAVVLIPLLLSVPPLFGVEALDIHTVSGITMLQVLVTSALGVLLHRRGGNVHATGVVCIGMPLGVCALGGAMASRYIPADGLLLLFGILVLVPFFLMLLGNKDTRGGENFEPFNPHRRGCMAVGSGVGLICGLLGAGGGFILVPLLVSVLKFPFKVAVGSSLGIIFIGAVLGSIGKIVTFQVAWRYVFPVLLGSVPMVYMGSVLCRRLPARAIRYLFLLLLLSVAVGTWNDILLRSM